MLIMLIFPAIEAFAFWLLLRRPQVLPVTTVESTEELISDDKPLVGFKEKMSYIKHLFGYMLPLCLVYFFEYFINQGMVSEDACSMITLSNMLLSFSLNWSTLRTSSWTRHRNIAGLMWTIRSVSSFHAPL